MIESPLPVSNTQYPTTYNIQCEDGFEFEDRSQLKIIECTAYGFWTAIDVCIGLFN